MPHISYVHSPPRYLWGEAGPSAPSRAALRLASPVVSRLRAWDARAAYGVTAFLTNSALSATRVARVYRKRADILHPPVDAARFSTVVGDAEGHLLAIGELVPYKRFDLAVLAAARTRIPLAVVGDGPERGRLERLAQGHPVRFLGRIGDDELLETMNGARALLLPGIEDFGIVMVEALAAGIPVIAPAAGGALEIIDETTGLLVDVPSADGFARAVSALSARRFDPRTLRARAAAFDEASFRDNLRRYVFSTIGSLA